MTRRLDFRLLGPLEVLDGARSLPLGGRKQRSLLALLLLHANEVVSIDSLMDGLWGERAPKTAGTALQVYVSNLRKLLSPERLVTRRPGYGLRVEPEELDLARFEGLCAQARGDEPAATATALGEALSLWRGPALCDFAYDSFAQGEIARLDELRLAALERRIEAELALGKHAELVGELEALVGEHPLRERLRELLILSLYRCGRQADALEAYRQARKTLVEEHGIEPSSSLKELEKSILAQDAELAPPPASRRTNLPSAGDAAHRPRARAGRARRARVASAAGDTDRVGGSGKTRLALEPAAKLVEDYPDGVWWVPLAALRDPGLVEPTIAHLLSVKDGLARTCWAPRTASPSTCADKRTLLVLDNFEQLVEAAPQLSELLAETEHVAILVTSREPLHVSAEHQYPVPPLPEEDAVALFTARARQVTPGFEATETVAEICRRLDGLPLAIELAAARVKVLEPEQILARIEHRLELLTAGPRDAPERQRTLRATIEWSYELLDDAEQQLFAGLAVFVGGFDLEAAEAVCSADLRTLAALIDKSLLRPAEQGRFVMLETIREYALERLEEAGDLDRIRRRHFDFFLTLAEEANEDLERDQRAGIWLERLELEHDNCRAALQWARELGEPRLELRLVTALSLFWDMRGHWDEGRNRLAEPSRGIREAPADLRGHALRRAVMLAHKQGDPDAARALAEEATAGYRATGDTRGLAHALSASWRRRSRREESPGSTSAVRGKQVDLRGARRRVRASALAAQPRTDRTRRGSARGGEKAHRGVTGSRPEERAGERPRKRSLRSRVRGDSTVPPRRGPRAARENRCA